MDELNQQTPDEQGPISEGGSQVIPVSGLYDNWFLDYASYVILERAVPSIFDGFKPVQRRIMHAMKEMDDGRFNKVANIIGQTMQYHPHGDASIGDALVHLGQKELLIETQGNWGDIRTGDSAAAPRYIEARLSKFALEVAFNDETTDWQLSYDGRKKEPINLPVKFPLLLAQGADGIAVGLATKILPHNFCELIEASIKVLKGKPFELFPDFLTGGQIDVTDYQAGARGGKVKVRAKIECPDKKTLLIKDIPFSVTTGGLIDSILKANDKGKIKIKKVVDNTAQDVEIAIELAPAVSPDQTIDALYAFTDCEISISPNACVIINDKPHFLDVHHILKFSTDHTLSLLKWELENRKNALEEKWHFSSLERIFIENRIYRDIEECETWESVIETIDIGLNPFKHLLFREVTREDIIRLTEIKIKRISKFDSFKAEEAIRQLEKELDEVKHHLAHLTDYAIDYFQKLLNKYGKGRERKTEIRTFDAIAATQVAIANEKLYVNRKEGFVGYGMKKDEYVGDCSDIDDIIVFRQDGKYSVSKVSEKAFFGKEILHLAVWRKNDERTVYNAIYLDGKSKKYFVKRFAVTSITRDKEYDVTLGTPGSRLVYFTANPNSESEVVTIQLTPAARARMKVFEFDFGTVEIKGRNSKGNTLTKYPVKKVVQKEVGKSTLGGRKIWLDEAVGRLNTNETGRLLGEFDTEDRILVLFKDGSYELTDFELTNRYDMAQILFLEKWNRNTAISCVYYDGEKKNHFVKRFLIETTTTGQKFRFITEHKQSALKICSLADRPVIQFVEIKGKGQVPQEQTYDLADFIDVKGWKSLGNRLSMHPIKNLKLIAENRNPIQEENVPNESETNSEQNPVADFEETTEPKNSKTLEVGQELEWEIEPPKETPPKTESKPPLPGNQGKLF